MTRKSSLFCSSTPCNGTQTVKIADGSLTKVKGLGIVQNFENLSLKFLLHVPNLSCNLVSVSKLTKDLNYIANFHPNHCIF